VNFGTVTNTLAGLSLLAGAVSLAVLVALAFPAGRRAVAAEVAGRERLLLGSAWLVATVASAGSLYYSEIVGFVPCVLCWYQRIAMYPLVVLLAVGALGRDPRAVRYALPLSAIGLLIALYHVMIQFRPALDVGMCDAGVPCSARYLSVFGFVSIPVMAAGGFLLVSALLLAVPLAERGHSPRERYPRS
jgi:disulfide bond formation protein DsbB